MKRRQCVVRQAALLALQELPAIFTFEYSHWRSTRAAGDVWCFTVRAFGVMEIIAEAIVP
jgi:hypothetical protein